ncbi:hypothetical protein SVI_1887 [Shewanella violacea DSS12]|uniref:Uncharacterized protein n=1 Tax=Shewanella violacea (strain JCM 10179 / CIP 106290 / LMG 19151 / DSS12) TaxID=637905 RepID=D4ZJK9_SHEVD|nr:hypothetical protein SVI_1887 [Shewanella violacea DSS12]
MVLSQRYVIGSFSLTGISLCEIVAITMDLLLLMPKDIESESA